MKRKVNPKEVEAIGTWLSAVVKDDPSRRIFLVFDGRLHDVTKMHMVKTLYAAAKELKSKSK